MSRAWAKEAGEALKGRLAHILSQVRASVTDWKPMLARLDQAIHDFRYVPVPLNKDEVTESDRVPRMAARRQFHLPRHARVQICRGRDERHAGAHEEGPASAFSPIRTCWCCGAAPSRSPPRRKSAPSCTGRSRCIVTKANAKSVVHRRIYLDYIGVKTFDAKGKLTGELRIVGLFTSTAYTRSVMKIPYLRSKVTR
jgi:glutamate dehydrogenase